MTTILVALMVMVLCFGASTTTTYILRLSRRICHVLVFESTAGSGYARIITLMSNIIINLNIVAKLRGNLSFHKISSRIS